MTPEDQNLLIEEAETNIRVAVGQKVRKYGKFFPYADLWQEAVFWILQHPGTVRGRLDDGRRGSTRLTNQIAKHLDGLCRKEKAYGLYDPSDEEFYTRAMVEAVLPALWDENYALKPPDPDREFSRQPSDLSESGAWTTMVIDVRSAWKKASLDEKWMTALFLRYGEGLRIYQVAIVMEVADSTAHSYVTRGIRAIIQALGGPAPGRCPPECECQQTIGTRKVQSNAQARVENERQYGE